MAAASTLREDLWSYLNGRAAFADAIGREADGGAILLFARVAPTDASGNVALDRYAVMNRISSTREHHMRGAAGQARAVFQFDLYAKTDAETIEMAEALRASVDGIVQTKIGAGGGGTHVGSASVVSEIDDWIGPKSGSESGTYVVSVDVELFYRESVPALV